MQTVANKFEPLTARDKLLSARAYVTMEMPYLAQAVMACAVHEATTDEERKHFPTAGVTARWNLYYNKDFIDGMPQDAVVGVFFHELMHLIADDAGAAVAYGQGLDPLVWNIACDLVINPAVRANKFQLPVDKDGKVAGVFPGEGQFAELKPDRGHYSREELYVWLMRNRVRLQLPSGGGVGNGDCGSGATGRGFESDTEPKGPEQEKAAGAKAGMSKVEADAVRQKVAQEVLSHAKHRGSVPAELLRWAEGFFESRVNWKAELSSMVLKVINTWLSGSRRRTMAVTRARHGILNPTYRAKRPIVAFVLDTSGSMSDEQVMQGVTEAVAAAHRLRADVLFVATDAEAHGVHRFKPGQRVDKDWVQGGGGTVLTRGLTALVETGEAIAGVIVLTDGYTDWPSEADPRLGRHVAVVVDGTTEGIPDFFKVIEVSV